MKYTFINRNGNQQTINIPEEFIARNRRALGISTEEACELYLSDEGYIDNEVVQEINEIVNAGKKKINRKRKEDPVKRALVQYIFECIDDKAFSLEDGTIVCGNVAITNPERIVRFDIDDDTYEITLSRKRKPKA